MLNHGRCLSLSEFAHVAQNDSPRRESMMSAVFDVANDFVPTDVVLDLRKHKRAGAAHLH
jgi:hypothetical protein